MQPVSTHSSLIKRARQEAVFLASSLIERGLNEAIAALEKTERTCRSIALRMELSDAGHALAKHRAALRGAFSAAVDEGIGQALEAAQELPAVGARAVLSEDDLALVEDAEVSRFVEASRLQQAMMPVVEEQLARLDSLISSAMGLAVVRADLNPLRPDVLCGALLQVLDRQPEDEVLRAHWARHLAKPFAREINGLYAAVATLLEAEGVEEARYRLKLTEAGPLPPSMVPAPEPESASGGGGGGDADGELPSDADQLRQRRALFPRMNDLAQAHPVVSRALMHDFLYRPQWTAEYDEPLPSAYYDAVQQQIAHLEQLPQASYDAVTAARTRARALALSAVDRPARPVAPDQPLSPEQWGEEVASPQARARTLMALKSRASKISEALGLDAVRTLVGQVAGDGRVLAPVREAVVAMEPTLLRMAMSDPRFFGDDKHPARRLIEGVAQRSFKYNDEYADEFEQFMAPVRQAVRELNDQSEPQSEAFAARLQSLEADWQQQDAAEAQARERGVRSMQFAQERQVLANKVAWEFSLRSDVDRVPPMVVDFLFDDWSLVIAHAQLTDERGQLDPGGYLAVVSDLLWSVKREAALKQPTRLFEVVPGMVQTLRRGLHMLGKEPQETQGFFDALMHYQDPVLRLRRLRSARDAEVTGLSRLSEDSVLMPLEAEAIPLERPRPRTAEQPWLGRHELAAAGFEDGPDDSGSVPLTADTPPREAEALASPAGSSAPDGATKDDGFSDTLPTAPPPPSPSPTHTAARVPPAAGALPPAQPTAMPRADAGQQATPATAQTAESVEDIQARTRAQLARLRTGDWVDLKVRDEWRRAQLHWTSDNGALFLFISGGGRAHSMTRRTCEKLLRNRHLRPVDASAVIDKALRQLSDEARSTVTTSMALS